MIGAQKVGYLGREVRAHQQRHNYSHDPRYSSIALCQTCTQNHISLQDYPWLSLNSKNSVAFVKHSIRPWRISSQKRWCRYVDSKKLWLTGVDPRTDVGIQTVATSTEIPSAWASSPSSWSTRADSPIYGSLVGPIYEWDVCGTVLGLGSGFREYGYGTVDFCHSCSDVYDTFWRTSVLTERYMRCANQLQSGDVLQVECSLWSIGICY
jgi:hypothetical protein